MEQSLVEDLNDRLSQLETKVQVYRQELVCEFGRYYGETLRDVDDPTATGVSHTIAQSLEDRYPGLTLGGELRQLITSTDSDSGLIKPYLLATTTRPCATNSMDSNLDSTQSISSHRQSPPHAAVFGAAVPVARPPHQHERESEFHGLFTPSFLPLLESSPNLSASASPPSPIPAAPAVTSSYEPAIAGSPDSETSMGKGRRSPGDIDPGSPHTMQVQLRQVQDTKGQNEMTEESSTSQQAGQEHQQPTDPAAITTQTTAQEPSRQPRPSHFRRGTDDTLTSALSDKSDSTTPRSALRRSPSTSRPHQQGVRRVRFELLGAEVLPTASPQPSDLIAIQGSSSSGSSDKPTAFDDPLDENGDFEKPSLPPRKISSSEALRALSRAPLDEGTVWTVVNADAERSSSPASKEKTSSPSTFETPVTGKPPMPKSDEAVEARRRLAAIGETQTSESPEDGDSSEDDEFLSIGKTRSRKTILTPVPRAKVTNNITATTNTTSVSAQSNNKLDDVSIEQSNHNNNPAEPPGFYEEDLDLLSSDDIDAEDDDTMFHFESGGLSAPPVPKRKPPLVRDEIEDSPPQSPDKKVDLLGTYATSPAVPITRPQPSSGSSTPTGTRFHIGSLGSYKGRPVVMPVVKDPELLAQAESLGEFTTFVGGLDGRSGIDDSDLSSFRASLVPGGFSGTPRSLTERMLMEEHAERNKGS